ncbi:MAG TPA: 3-isopropylmalate dehydratase small subunit, partial [Steroidobacteraceae bacterium]
CGSSREHAPWALRDYGFRAVVSTQIADIFRNNCLKNGVLPVVVDEATNNRLLANPGAEIEIDLESTTLRMPTGERVSFPIEAFARYCLLNGLDELDFLLSLSEKVAAYKRRRFGADAYAET